MKNNEEKRALPSFVIGMVVIIIIVLLLVVALRSLIKHNELLEKYDAYLAEQEEVLYENQRLKNESDKELDEETIKKIAKEELGLVDPDAEYYYSD